MLTSASKLRLGAAAAFLFAAAAPLGAAEPVRAPSDATAETGGAPAAKADEPKKERMICRIDEQTSSRVRGKKICLTAAQWRARGF